MSEKLPYHIIKDPSVELLQRRLSHISRVVNQVQLQYLTFTGVQDGVNKVFRLPFSPQLLLWFWNGALQSPGTDYILVGNQVTMTLAPAFVDALVALGSS